MSNPSMPHNEPSVDTVYRRLFESANAGILIMCPEFKFTDCNKMASMLLDRPKDEIVGLAPDDPLLSPKYQPNGETSSEMGRKMFSLAMQGQDPIFEWTHLKRDGTECIVEVSLFGFVASKKRNFFAMWKDLTEIKTREQEVKRYQEHLESMVAERTAELERTNTSLQNEVVERQKAIEEIRTLRGILPICSICKKIRNDKGYWDQLEEYLTDHTNAQLSHSLCPDCLKKEYPYVYEKMAEQGKLTPVEK